MKVETEILLKEYKEEFKNYKNYLDANNWFDDIQEDKNGNLYSNKLNTELSIVSTILKSMKKFKEDVGEDAHLKPIKKFIDDTVNIVKKHVDRIDLYKRMYPLDEASGEKEVKFQSELFGKKTSTKVDLSKLNIDEKEETRKSLDLFHGKTKAPLLMREYLCESLPIVDQKTSQLSLDFYSPSINPATSNEMLINMNPKDIPKWDVNKHFFEQDLSTIQFWEEEIRKIKNGVTIGGYYIHPWLYWHLNIFMLSYGSGDNKKPKNPRFRDNEYFFTEMLKKAEDHGKVGLLMYGSRRISKSVVMTSYLQRILYTVRNAKCTVLGFSEVPDLKAIVDYMNESITNLNPALRINANNLDLKQGITLGLKKTAQERLDYSDLTFVNLEAGSKKGTQKPAASTPDAFIFDEIGKGQCIKPWDAAKPSFADSTKGGKWRLVPIASGCVCAGTKVYTHNGNLINIEDLEKKDGIIGFDKENRKISKEPITWLQPPTEKECYRIITKKGHKLECSYEHPILVRHRNKKEKIDNKWVRKIEFIPTEKLEIGQQIVINDSVDIWGKNKMWEPRLVGWFIGDGHYGKNDIPSISSCDSEINEYISANFETSVKGESHITKEGKTFLNRRLKGTSKYLKKLGIYGQTKCNKTLPKDLYLYSKEDLSQLIGGLFDADGHVSIKGTKPEIRFTSKCENLIIEIRDLLNKFGIHPSYYKVVSKVNSKVNIETEYFVLNISDKRSFDKFYENIEFKVKYKQELLEKGFDFFKSKKEKIPKELEGLRLDSIVSIEKIGLKPIYNLTAGFTNTYLANNIITHNTAGESELSKDAELILKNPQTYDFLPMDWDLLESKIDPDYITWNRQNFGYFVPAQLSIEAPDKITIPFSKFLEKDEMDDLNNITIDVTDWKAAKEYFEERREAVSKDIDILSRLTNSFPMDVEDCYMTSEVNKFPGLLAKRRKRYVEDNGIQGQKVWLVRNGDTIEVQQTNDPIITDYPYKGGNIDAPIVILDDPYYSSPNKPPLGLYCIGFDDVKQDRSDGDSVMSATVFKRSYEGGEWANRIVAYYDSRPEKKRDYYKNLYLLIKYYNARILHENEDNGFIEYMEDKHMEDIYAHVSDGVGLATEENLNRNKNRKFGWSPTPLNIYNLEQSIVVYTKEENIVIGIEEDLNGIDRINHPMLLEELYKYKKGKNADRIRSFGLALKLARYYDKTYAYMKNRSNVKKEDSSNYYKKENKKEINGFTYTNKLVKY